MKRFLFLIIALTTITPSYAQSIVNEVLRGATPVDSVVEPEIMGCGHYSLMENKNKHIPNYIDLMDDNMREISQTLKQQNQLRTFSENEVVKVKVVFHVVHNEEEENIPDSVLHNQIQVLNENFRRTHPDTADTRAEFKDLVGDSKIEFVLADKDPNGNPTDGIVRTNTNVEYFGGVLPYSSGQNQEIETWVNDSLFYNLFRITKDTLGGSDAWDTDRYLNVWMGDLRIFEPEFNNLEEVVYLALATPPNENLIQWPDSIMQALNGYDQGVLIHYPTVGSNNPAQFSGSYQGFNNIAKSGKILVHEVGHYLGLRHIWGDGDCSVDDFIDDTPNSDGDSQWGCSHNKNRCPDNIEGNDLPDMVENYMDYSRGSCQNSFTKGQIEMMRHILGEYREGVLNVETQQKDTEFSIYPNPTSNKVYINSKNNVASPINVSVYNPQGQLIVNQSYSGNQEIEISLKYDPGVYIINIVSENGISNFKIVKQ